MAYRIGTSGGLGYREWDPSTSSWSSEASLTSAGAQIEAVKFLYSPVAGSELRIIGVRETNGEIDIYYCTADCTNPASWTGPTLVADMGTPTGGRKYFDMAFEHASGDLLIVYDKTTAADTNDFFYQVFDADTLTLSGESGFDYISDTTTDNDIRFFKTASKLGSDEIAVALLDTTNSDAVALIWDGSSFGNQLTVTDTVLSASLTGESFDIAYESSSGAALVVAPGLATNEVRYARYTGSWSAVSTLSGGINPDVTGDDPVWMTVKPDPNPSSNKIMVCSTDDVSDFSCVQFDAGVPGTPIRHDAATGGASRRGDFAWVGWDSTGLALWYDSAAASYQHSRWDGSGWGTEVSTAVAQALIWVTAISDNDSTTGGVDSLWALYSQAAPDNIGDGEYDSTTFTLNGLGTISTSAGTANTDDVVSLDSRKPRSYSRSLPDSVAVSADITAKITGRAVPDSLPVSDSVARVYNNVELTSSSIAISDVISTSLFSPGNAYIFENLGIADSVHITVPRSMSDGLSVADTPSKRAAKPVAETLALTSDVDTRVAKNIPESLSVADTPARMLSAPRSVPVTITFTDSIPSDSNAAGMAYRSATGSGANFPKYREWNPQTFAWSQEVELPSAGSPVRFAWIEFSPVSAKRVIVTLSDDGFLDSYACDNQCTQAGSWTVQNNVAQVRSALTGIERPFDIEFERTSGDLMLVYDRVSTDSSQDLFYRIMPDSSNTFGSEFSINDTSETATDVSYSFIRMDSRRTSGSDAIGMIALDATNSDAVAWIWDGGAWGNESELTGTVSVTNRQAVDIAYESNSGNLVVAAGEGTAVRYNRFTTSWQTSSTSTGTWDTGTINWVKLVPNPASNEIFMGAVGSLNDLDSSYWDGSSWTDHAEHDAGLGSIAGPSFDFAWDGAGSGIIIWGTTAGQLDFKRLTAPDVFSSQDSFADTGSHNWIQLAANPLSSDSVAVLGATIDNANDISGLRWNGSASSPTSTGDNAITISGLDTYESARVDFQKAQRIGKTVFDSVGLSDSVSRMIVVNRTINDPLALAVQATTHAPTPVADGFVIDDKINYRVTRFIAVALDVEDAIVAEPSSGVLDIVGLQDGISIAVTKLIGDSLGSSDALALKPSNIRLDDGVAIADAVNTGIPVLLSDGIGVSDVLVGARSVDISDSIGVAAALTDVSWSRTLALADGLGLASDSCTPAECLLNLVLGESLALQDEWLPPPGAQDTIAVVDSVAANALYHTQVAESLSASDRPETALAVAPPDIPASWDLTEMPRAMIVTEPGLVEPPEAQELPGTYSASGGIASLLQQTDMPVYSTSQMTSATDMTGKTIVLPLFQVSMTPTDDMPGRNAILTPIIDSLPADVKLSLPVDIGSTLSEEAEAHPVSWMNLDFAPDSSGSNFALMLSMLDTKPAAAQDVKAQVSAFFIDLDWTGSFAGSATPADSGFYSKPPDLTFAITDAWATGQDLARDQNGVPVMEMFLLNDATGEWERVPGIDSPAGAVDGSYTYVAHLQHFSTYVATSAKAPSGFSQGAPREPVSSFTALLSDTVSVTDSQEGRALELIEEFAGKKTAVTVLELLNVASKPIAFGKTLQAGTNVSVGIALDDVSTSSIIPPEVKATLVLDVKNAGGSMERFLLNIRYFDQSGKVAYDTSQRIEIGPYESSQMIVQVPFTTSGDFVISLDARSEAENRILGTAQIEVAVPWLAVNMHLIIATAAATFAGAGTMLAYILRRQKTGEDAQVI